MSSKKRRAERRTALALRAYAAAFRQPERDTLRTAFKVRHEPAMAIHGAGAMKWMYRLYMRSRGVDVTVIIERDGIVFRRLL
jgi:NADPH-dependent 2,4-dienoyl-CoA reductase/sulfur reductase-like enzyme